MEMCWNLPSLLLVWVVTMAQAFMEVPKFGQMKLLYPGYYLHGGLYRDREIMPMVGGNATESLKYMHNTAPLRMSVALNRYSGRHAIGTEPVFLSKRGRDSCTGKDGQEYIFRNTAFGPFLAAKYGNPVVVKPNKQNHELTMLPFHGKQGIVRMVSYHRKHPGGHMGLWDCDHFYQSRDWSTETHIISVEFWETPDSYCPEASHTSPPPPHLQQVNPSEYKLIPRHNLPPKPKMSKQDKMEDRLKQEEIRLRHQKTQHRNPNLPKEVMWVQ